MRFANARALLLHFMRPHWRMLSAMVLMLLAETALAAAQPLVMAPMMKLALEQENIFSSDQPDIALSEVNLNNIDIYVSQQLNLGDMDVWNVVIIISLAYLGLILAKAAAETLGYYFFSRVRIMSFRSLQKHVFAHLLTLPLGFYKSRQPGELVSRVEQDNSNATNLLMLVIKSLATAPVMIAIYGYLLVRTDLSLMLLVGAIALLQWGAARLLRDRLRALVRDEFDLIAKFRAFLSEIFQNIRVVKSFAAEDYERESLNDRIQKLIPVHINRAMFRHWQVPITEMLTGIANVSILMLSARELFNGNLTVVGFGLFLYLGRSIIGPINEMGAIYLNLQEMEAAIGRVFEIIQEQSPLSDGPIVKKDFKRSIQFKDVTFSYGESNVLEDLNIEIERGEMVALVGPSGAGKSTLTDLLMRFYDPSQGEIQIDGVDLRELKVDEYRRLFGVVAQENLLFNQSIHANIAYGDTELSQAQVREAAQVANAADFIEEIPDKYETNVGDRGVRLSGGQRQRVAIARAIAHKPQILILDEATSSLDTESERLVQAAIDSVIQDTTAIVVAHRLSTVLHADKIFVLEDGRVLDQGKHDELYERCDLYRHLCELQFQVNGTEGLS